jgi:CelD/BcsL family acetyltransferase involved in cellulose biosynthesis
MGDTLSRETNNSLPGSREAPELAATSVTNRENSDIRVLTIEEAESKGWNRLVADHPLGSVFQHTAFLKMIAATFGHTTPYCVSLLDGDEQCRGGLALFLVQSWLTGRRLVSIPFTFYADPMAGSPEEFARLFQMVRGLAEQQKASYIEIKALHSVDLLAGSRLMTPVYHHRTYYLDLTKGLDAIWQGLHRSSVKQKIRRAERNGITIRYAQSEPEVALFHRLLARNRRRLGLPPHRPEYFQNTWRYLVPVGLARFSLAYLGDELIGGLCTFLFRETAFLGYIAMEESLRCDGVGQCLFWNEIRVASEERRKIVDLGKTSPYAHGLVRFKENWGSIMLEAPVFYYPRAMGVSSYDNEQRLAYRALRLFWRTLPSRWAAVPSRFLYRHMG